MGAAAWSRLPRSLVVNETCQHARDAHRISHNPAAQNSIKADGVPLRARMGSDPRSLTTVTPGQRKPPSTYVSTDQLPQARCLPSWSCGSIPVVRSHHSGRGQTWYARVISSHWSDAIFTRLRRALGPRLELMVLFVAEFIALSYYQAYCDGTGARWLRR